MRSIYKNAAFFYSLEIYSPGHVLNAKRNVAIQYVQANRLEFFFWQIINTFLFFFFSFVCVVTSFYYSYFFFQVSVPTAGRSFINKHNGSYQYRAISRKVVGKTARDNPERHCGYVCMCVCKSLFKHGKSSVKLRLKTKTNYNCWVVWKFERIGTKGRGNVFASA